MPILSPGLATLFRIGNVVLVFKIGTDEAGNVTCIRAISGHPIMIPAAMQSIRAWKLRPTTIGWRRRPIAGTLVLSISWQDRGTETKVLDEEPPRR